MFVVVNEVVSIISIKFLVFNDRLLHRWDHFINVADLRCIIRYR